MSSEVKMMKESTANRSWDRPDARGDGISVLHVIKTPSVEHDDRLCKEADLMACRGNEVRILALEAFEHRARSPENRGAVEVQTIALTSRKVFADGQFRAVKAIEMNLRFGWLVLCHRGWTIWLHDFDMIGLVVVGGLLARLGWIRSVVWDQHELPPEPWLRGRMKRALLRLAYAGCGSVIAANAARRDYILETIGGLPGDRYQVVQNFPSASRSEHPRHSIPDDVAAWLQGNRYVVNEGMAQPERRIGEVLAAIISQEVYRLVVVGPLRIDESEVEEIAGPKWRERIFITGLVTQDEIYPILDNAEASLIFYGMGEPNLAYCAPNRLYHATCRGVPVIVGSNPSLKRHVKQVGNGLIIDGDGSDPAQIVRALEHLASNYSSFKAAAERARKGYSFENQAAAILGALQIGDAGSGSGPGR